MNQYELMFIINPSLADKEREELIASVKTEITSRSGKIVKEDIWWERKFAYKINKSEVGFYVLLYIPLDGAGVKEVTKQLNLKEQVWRSMFVKQEA